MLSEIRIESLGAIKAANAEFDRGLTVLTGETGTGKTMVVTGLHLLGGARADANRVRSGSDRAVVEGRFTTAEISAGSRGAVDEILDSSGSERDDDGSVIALRSVSRDGPSRAYLGGRSVPAKSLSTFTAHLLTLHGQNDQLRLMRPDEQRAALDRFADVTARLERYQKVRDEWRRARRDLIDRTERARELAQEADRLKFALGEIDTVDPRPGEDQALVAEIRRLSELDALREAASAARVALSGDADDPLDSEAAAATTAIGRAMHGPAGHRRRRAAEPGHPTRRDVDRRRGGGPGDRWIPVGLADRRQHVGDQAGPAGRVALTDPQVRRRRGRGAGLGRRVAGPVGPARRFGGGADGPGTHRR